MSGRRRLDWLGLTPEPERELPAAVAALRASLGTAHHPPPGRAELAAAERRRVERLVLRGSRHSWLRYLTEATALVTAVALRLDEQGGKDRQADTDADMKADADTRAGAGTDTRADADTRADSDANTRADPDANTRADPDADTRADADTDVSTAAALLAAEVILDHHRMLIGLPGAGYGRTAGDRAALESALRLLRTRSRTAGTAPTARTGDGR
ncbi:hypothetical protein [Streptomyces sp. TLI_105]|uniref:hypothetical protein n=1 Tax=Streptomyces sp. TLI_105 TaxID=1881019 RepID=UPI000898EF4A|nr:hypothetical protein [Streptomyces sp. TLI_105]SEE08858.1 hypothetical protein SAMN05428939_7296 [Streptomyces sp. TLI_105]